MAVQDGRVLWVGSDAAAGSYADGADEVIELDGALVTPAFVDAHLHATSTGLALEGLDLSAATSLRSALAAVERYATRMRGRPIIGHGWDETRWPEGRPPTRVEVDRVSYGGVVYLSRVDVHSAVVSSALAAAAPAMRSAAGWRDDGVVSTEAHHIARRVAREALAPDQRRAAQRAALGRAAAQGIGCVHELGGPDISSEVDLREIIQLAATEPAPDVLPYWAELGGAERAAEIGALGAAGDLFADGAIGSRTAALRAVYADADTTGHAYLDAAQVRDHVVACTRAGLQAGFHAIGDGALDAVVGGFREAAEVVGVEAVRAARHRLEHVEMIDARGIGTLAGLGVVASVQPAFDRLWGGAEGMYAQRLGRERALSLNPFAAMAQAGVLLAFGSDSPVTPIDPWGTVRAAAWHHVPDQRLGVAAAFTAHTRGGWFAARRDDGGVLAPGAAATYAVWHAPERTVAPGAAPLPSLDPTQPLPTCLRTVVRGRPIYIREGAPS
jgi:predicted amidohydrolase YtcJ